MPTIYPNTFTGTSVAVLNTIRDSASTNYREFVPVATEGGESVKEIGAIIMQYPALQNEFLNFLMNRIGREIITSRMFENPLKMFKKGFLDFGETVEEIFVNLAKVYAYNPSEAATNVFNIETPDVRAAFHIMNVQARYKQSVNEAQLRQAFLSWDNMDNFIRNGIIAVMYKSMEYDEFNIMKYMAGRVYLNGNANPVTITDNSGATITINLRAASTDMTILNPNMNPAGVYNSALRDDQYLIIPSLYEATLDVNVLAYAFNMSKAEFLGHVVPIDSFTNIDNDRLANILEGFVPFTDEETTSLNALVALLVDDNFFQIYDKLLEMRSIENTEGLYWNYSLHAWKICSTSPFANRMAFVSATAAGAVTSVTVTAPSNSITLGSQLACSASVVGTLGVDKSVTWTLNSAADGYATIDSVTGLITYSNAVASNTTITVTATSNATPTVSGTLSITLLADS